MEELEIKKRKGHEESAESWAVSYADLLMVLMSFFIVFFSLEEKKSGEFLLSSIVAGLKDHTGAQILDEKGTPISGKSEKLFPGFVSTPDSEGREPASVAPANLKPNFTIIISKLESPESDKNPAQPNVDSVPKNSVAQKTGLQIDLVENIYSPGSYEMSQEAKTQLEKVLAGLLPFKEKINLVFVGHTDAVPIKAGKNVIESNMILSSLRASKAVEMALSKGYNPYWVSAQGFAEYSRNTRSLSLRVMER
jgi:chemotaxis protein MotB